MISWLVFSSSSVISYIFYLFLGAQNPEFSYTFYIIAIGLGIHIALLGVGSAILRGIGIVEYAMYSSIVKSSIILTLGVIFAKAFGFTGLLLVIFIATIASAVYFCLRFDKFNNVKPFILFRRTTLFPFLLGLILFGIFRWAISAFGLISISKITNFIYFMVFSLAFSLIYFSLTFLLRYFSQDEIEYIKNKYKVILLKIKTNTLFLKKGQNG